ncbi:recombinase family protein [Sphingomonas sp. PB2P19]|uniref:recombinase family protein n=1 Tax=Sphingomonas rhamnosi TaxID=3096156 RepID=UPI003FA71A26
MTTGVIGAVAEFERDLLVERTKAGLARAKSANAVACFFGRATDTSFNRSCGRVSLGLLAKRYGVSRAAIRRAEKHVKYTRGGTQGGIPHSAYNSALSSRPSQYK